MRKCRYQRQNHLEVFLYAIRSNATKSRYLNRLKNFEYTGLEGDVKAQARAFVLACNEKGKYSDLQFLQTLHI